MRFFFLLLLISGRVYGQDSTKIKTIKVLPVPAFGYSPETKTYIGAVSLFTFNFYKDSVTRQSNAKIEFNYTWNKQMIIDGGWNYFSRDENWFTKGQITYSKYPDFYYGIGSATAESDKLLYNSNRFVFDVYALKKIKFHLFTGLNLKYSNYWNLEIDNASTVNYSELKNSAALGLGYSILKDNRNSILTPTKGVYALANTTYNFSSSNYIDLFFDLRYYKTWKDKFTLASRFVNDFNINNPPFFDYAILGGDKFVRGYYYGRYRDKNLSTLQAECRFPLVWRFGLATFGGISNIYPNLSALSLSHTKYNAGLGLRFLVDRKDNTNLRLDYAIGKDNNNGFYVSFGESF
ncbi:MAG: BamA/TamA family outer membrane protein [Niabella sp.]